MKSVLLCSLGFPPEGQIFGVSSFHLRVVEEPHAWVTENDVAIRDNWQREVAANPHLFNGEMVLQRALCLAGDHIEGIAHMVPFASFLHWRRSGRGAGAHHLFAAPMIISADGAVMAIRMAETTANPGRVYSPAGSLDRQDVKAGLCDLDGNMHRETGEETGLDLGDMNADAIWRGVHMINSVAVFRVFRSPLSATELQERVAEHVAADAAPEISGMIAIRSPDPHAHDYAPFMPPVLDWIFSEGMK